MTPILLRKLPIPNEGCGAFRSVASSVDLLVEYEYYSEEKNQNQIGSIKFNDVVAFRFTDEMHCDENFPNESYNSIAELRDSEWQKEMNKDGSLKIGQKLKTRKHFAIFLNKNGYLEAFAESFEELEPREGSI